MNKIKNTNICQLCKQDMRALPHEDQNGKDCPQCGQGINWKAWQKRRRLKDEQGD